MASGVAPRRRNAAGAAVSYQARGRRDITMKNVIRLEAIPDELRRLPQWVCWRFVQRSGKPTKLPINCASGHSASSTDRTTWTTFDHAVAFWQNHDADGIGFVLAEGGGIVGIDLDKCRNSEAGTIEPWARKIIDQLASYSEVTPSRTGVHVILFGKLPPKGRRRGQVEMYESGRFFTMTGEHLEGTPSTIEHREVELLAIHAEVFGKPKPEKEPNQNSQPHAVRPDDQVILEKAKNAANGASFSRLFSGDTSDYDGDESRADLALCSMIAFWTGPFPDHIDALFRQSGLYREKWERADYRQSTINKALEGRTEYYDWRQNGKKAGEHVASNGQANRNGEARDGGNGSQEAGETGEEGVNETTGQTGPEIHLTDLGNARRVVKDHGKDLHFCHPMKTWYVWDAKRWREDDTAEVMRRIKDTQGSLYRWIAAKLKELGDEGGDGEDAERAAKLKSLRTLLKHCEKWEGTKELEDCAKSMRSERRVPIRPAQLDTDPLLLNVLNGTIDLRTGQLRDHRREDLITKIAPVHFHADAQCPLWLACLDRWMKATRT